MKSIRVLIQAFSAQPHMHLTVLRTMGSGAFCRHFALVEHGSGQKRTKGDAIVGQIAVRKVDTRDVMENTRVYELDVPLTQQAKIGQYQKRHLAIPPSPVSLVPDPCTKRGGHERKKYRLA